jgi:flagellar biogenesis protein FliO
MAGLARRRTKFPAVDFTGLRLTVRRFFMRLLRKSCLDNVLEHMGSLPLTAQSSLALVRVREEALLLGITPQTITVLTRLPLRPANLDVAPANEPTDSLEAR